LRVTADSLRAAARPFFAAIDLVIRLHPFLAM